MAVSDAGIAVTDNTEKFLLARQDDFRLEIIWQVMYGDKLAGIYDDRELKMVDENDEKETSVILRKAGILDTMLYSKVPSVEDMKTTIEKNIGNIIKMKQLGGGRNGLPPIKDVWLFVFTTGENDDDLKVNSYVNPASSDIGDILRTNRQIIMGSFVLTYPTVIGNQKLPDGYPPEVCEWLFFSPFYSKDSIKEYIRTTAEIEAKKLTNMFFIDFTDDVIVDDVISDKINQINSVS